MHMTTKRWLLVLIFPALWVLGYLTTGGPPSAAEVAARGGRPAPTATSYQPQPIKVSARELVNAYLTNEVAADHNYRGEPLLVNGVVAGIERDAEGRPYAVLAAGGAIGVQAFFDNDGAVVRLKPGEAVSVQCVGVGRRLHVQMKECSLR
jgi:hypothetical protein